MSDALDFATGGQVAPGAPVARQSIAERMKAEIAARKAAKAPTKVLRHDAVPELAITIKIPTDGEEVADIEERAGQRAKGANTFATWFNRLLVARFCVGIEWHGEQLQDDDGTAWTFASKQVQEIAGAADAPTAVSALYGSDAYVGVIAAQLMDLAGFGNESAVEVVEDPTTGR